MTTMFNIFMEIHTGKGYSLQAKTEDLNVYFFFSKLQPISKSYLFS